MRRIFFIAFMQVCAFALFAQQTVKGRVLDENGEPLTGASVFVENVGQSTNDKGEYNFPDIKGKTVTLKISYIGYETYNHVVAIPFNKEIKLQKSVGLLQEITVSSLRANDKSPVAYTNVSKETIEKTNFGQDIPYLLTMTPSFVATSDAGNGIGYTGFRIRGTDASRINVTINGIPYNDADEQGTYWVDIPDFASSVENLQVQRGVGTSTNGAGAFGANINMQTSNFSENASGEIGVSGGSFGTVKATAKASTGLMGGHWAVDTRLSRIHSDGYIDRATTDMSSYFVQAGYYAEKTTVKLLTFGGTEKTYHAWDGISADTLKTNRTYNPCGYMGDDANGNQLYYKNQTDNYIQTNYQLLAIQNLTPELTLNAGLHYTRGDGYYEQYKDNETLTEYGLSSFTVDGETIESTDLVRQKWMGNNFAGGIFSLNYDTKKLSAVLGGALNDYWGQHWGDVTWVKNYIGTIYPDSEYYRSDINKWDGNIYLKANYKITKKLNGYADLQYRHVKYSLNGTNDNWDYTINQMQVLNINKTFNFFNPKVGLLYSLNKNNDLFASFAIANREPTRTNYTDGSENSWPTPEKLYDYETGYKYKSQNLSFGANLYYMNYKDQLILTGKINDIGEALTENIAKSYRAGIELVAGINVANWLRWDGAITLSRNRIKNFTEYVDIYDANWDWTRQQENQLKDTPIAFSPTVTGKSLFSFTVAGFEAGIQSIYVDKQYVDNTGSADRMLDAYFVNNLRMSYTIPVKGIQSISFNLLLNNLLNEMYESSAWVYSYYFQESANKTIRCNDFGYSPQAGFNFLAGITIKL
ncbi:MAG: TonB-dependent receptor [Paludibacter sp.]|nr:TonB-dependent receptor [Paludibacter sp.]